MTKEDYTDCRALARRVRQHCLRMVHGGRSGHIGSMLSMAEILATLYLRVLKVDPADPKKPDRDRLILSKGHGCAGLYAVLAECGFFPVEWLESFYHDGARLAGHATCGPPGSPPRAPWRPRWPW